MLLAQNGGKMWYILLNIFIKVLIIQNLLLDKYFLHILQMAKLRQKEAEVTVLWRCLYIFGVQWDYTP